MVPVFFLFIFFLVWSAREKKNRNKNLLLSVPLRSEPNKKKHTGENTLLRENGFKKKKEIFVLAFDRQFHYSRRLICRPDLPRGIFFFVVVVDVVVCIPIYRVFTEFRRGSRSNQWRYSINDRQRVIEFLFQPLRLADAKVRDDGEDEGGTEEENEEEEEEEEEKEEEENKGRSEISIYTYSK